MGGFSDNYECGYWDAIAPLPKKTKRTQPTQTNVFAYQIRQESDALRLDITLSPPDTLKRESAHMRTNLIKLHTTSTELEMRFEDNQIALFFENIYIGSVAAKYQGKDVSHIIKDFISDTPRDELEAYWDGDTFFLRKRKRCDI